MGDRFSNGRSSPHGPPRPDSDPGAKAARVIISADPSSLLEGIEKARVALAMMEYRIGKVGFLRTGWRLLKIRYERRRR